MPSRTTLQIQLASADGYVFEVPPQVYKCFKTIQSMRGDPFNAKAVEEVIPVPDVNACSLWKVLRWAEYHMHDKENDGPTLEICEWDRELLRVEKNMLIELVLAANYLGIQGLLDVASVAVIDSIKNAAPQIAEDCATMDDDFIADQLEKDMFNMGIEYEYNKSDSDEYDDDDYDDDDCDVYD